MAETQVLVSNNLQLTSGSCAECIQLETVGQKLEVNGKFNDYLNQSLNTDLSAGGESLPIDGNNLPQSQLKSTLSDLKFKLHALENDIQDGNINLNELTKPLKTTAEAVDEVVATDLQIRLDKIIGSESASQGGLHQSKEPNLSSFVDENIVLQDIINNPLKNIPDEVPNHQVPTTQTNVNITSLLQSNNLNLSITSVGIPSNGLQNKDVNAQQNLINFAEAKTEKPTLSPSLEKLDLKDYKSEKLQGFAPRYFTDGGMFQISAATPISGNSELLQQGLNTKSEPIPQNINISPAVESINNLNSAGPHNRAIEAPIPLLVKQGVEQAQTNLDQSFAQNIKWLINNNAQNAKINVYPEALGQVNIALNLEDSNLKINFIASSNITRDLIESSVTNLRNHLNESGINLQEVNIETRFTNHGDQSSQYSDISNQDMKSYHDESNNIPVEHGLIEQQEFGSLSNSLYLLDAYA